MSMIELSHILKRFGDATILHDISLGIGEGTVTALVGPSGGGKSTLLRCINLLEIPTSGRLTLGGKSIEFQPGRKPAWQDVQAIRRQTGMVFQNFQLFPHQTAIQNVMEGLVVVLKWPVARARERAMELLTKVGMAHKADAGPRPCRADSSSASPLRARWRRRRACFCATSRPRRWTRNWPPKWSMSCPGWRRRAPPW